MLYLDTSLIVAVLSKEKMTEPAQAWLSHQEPSDLTISDWTFTELASALAIKLRTGAISVNQRASVIAVFNQLVAESFTILPVTSAHFRTAARFIDQHQLGLRSGDALHLAVALDHGATVFTLDRRMAEAGPMLGVPVTLLG